MIYQYKNFIPAVHESSFIHPQSAITGNVIIGKNVYIGPFASLRGDFGKIVIEDGCNVQENCTIHLFPGVTVLLKENAHMGHGSVVHGATIGKNCLIGMNGWMSENGASDTIMTIKIYWFWWPLAKTFRRNTAYS